MSHAYCRQVLLGCALLLFLPASFAAKPVLNVEQLLDNVRQHQSLQKQRSIERERVFRQAHDQQQALVDTAKKTFLAAQEKNNPLQLQSDARAETIAALRAERETLQQDLGDISQRYQQFSADFLARMQDSLVQTTLPKRQEAIQRLQKTVDIADLQSLRELWVLLQEDMIEAAKASQYQAAVVNGEGEFITQGVSRFGSFTAIGEQGLLRYLPETQELLTVARQSSSMLRNARNSVEVFAASPDSEMRSIVIDPTRGSLLAMLGQSPSLWERVLQGKEVGFAIIALAVCGLLFALYRCLRLLQLRFAMRRQLKNLQQLSASNPLGRIFLAAQSLRVDESLQQVLDEAILKELPKLESGHSLIKLLAAIAPLLGLLGTVIGMIATFQSISLFGSGDPKLMASGISQALVTTVLGLLAAIPLLFAHNFLNGLSQHLIQLLDEQSAGLLVKAQQLEALDEAEHVG